MSKNGGKIYCPEAYARGKMVESSGWNNFLPRGGTPSDIDLIFDNYGKRIILVELSSRFCNWHEIPTGQRKVYESLVNIGDGKIYAVLAKHKTPEDGKYIDSFSDIEKFQVMYLGEKDAISEMRPMQYLDIEGSKWTQFVSKLMSV